MRALIILCACVSLAKCGAKIGSATTTTGLGSESPHSNVLQFVGSPVGEQFGQAVFLPTNFASYFNRDPTSQPLGHFQPFLNKPVVSVAPETAPLKRQVTHADFIGSSDPHSVSETPATEEYAPAHITAAPSSQVVAARSIQAFTAPSNQVFATPQHQVFAVPSNQVFAAPQHQAFAGSFNQILGILKPAAPTSHSTDILSSLLPDFIDVTNQLERRGIKGYGRDQATEIVTAFMPLMRKVMVNNARAEGRSLTQQEVDAINFAEKTVGPFVGFGYDVSDNGKGFTNPALPKNDVPNDFFAQMMVDLLPDLTRIVKQVKYQHGGWPGTGSAVEVMNLFIPFARRVVESQARIEGRFITREEQDYLRFGEDVVPTLMKYAQEAFITGNSLEAAEKYNVVDLVQSAWAKLKEYHQ